MAVVVKTGHISSDWHEWVYGGAYNPLKTMTVEEWKRKAKDKRDDSRTSQVVFLSSDKQNWKRIRTAVLRRYRYSCAVHGCKVRGAKRLEIHHIVPRDQGGSDEYDNLIPLCIKHHDEVELAGITSRVGIENLAIVSDGDDIEREPLHVPKPVTSALNDLAKAYDYDYSKLARDLGYTRPGAGDALCKIAHDTDVLLPGEQVAELKNRVYQRLDAMKQITKSKGQLREIKRIKKAVKTLSDDPRIDILAEQDLRILSRKAGHAISHLIDDLPLAQVP